MNSRLSIFYALLFGVPATTWALPHSYDNGKPPCATTYSVIQEDKLGNVQEGLTNPKNLKWVDKDLEKKYPDVCYVAPDQEAKTLFLITITPATYHGTRVDTTTGTNPTSGTVTDTSPGSPTDGQQSRNIGGKTDLHVLNGRPI